MAKWNFDDASDYSFNNVYAQEDYANLSVFSESWLEESNLDFSGALTSNNVDFISSGQVTLHLEEDLELLKNGDFSLPATGTLGANNWTVDQTGSGFTSIKRDDSNYWWEINYVDPFNTQALNTTVWFNQTFSIPSVPKNMNISALHRLQLGNDSYEIKNGTDVSISIINPANQTTELDQRTHIDSTDLDWVELWSKEKSFFNSIGNYTISLRTYIESNESNVLLGVPFDGVNNYWDNASVTYDAYLPYGNFTSQVYDAGSYAMWDNITWQETKPLGTELQMYIRTGNSSVPTDSIWSDWSGPFNDSTGCDITNPWGRYIQYKAEFFTTQGNLTPTLKMVNVTYEKYHSQGDFITDDFLPATITSWGFFIHDEVLNGQDVTYQYSTDSGDTWINMPIDGDLRNVDSFLALSFRGILKTSDSVLTPVVRGIGVTYISLEPAFNLEPVWNQNSAGAGETVRLNIYFNNTASSDSSDVWLNIYLDDRLEYISNNSDTVSVFDSYISDDNPNIQKYLFKDVPAGNYHFWIEAVVENPIQDGEVLQTTVTMDYNDPLGSRVESLLQIAEIRANAPKIEVSLMSLEKTADVGDSIHYQAWVNNTGHGQAQRFWLNATIDDRLELEGLNQDNLAILISGIPGNSSSSVSFNATLKDSVAQGSGISLLIDYEYSDSTGMIRSGSSNPVTIFAALRSDFSIRITSSLSQINNGDVFTVTVHYNNTGYGNAQDIEFNMTIPEGLDFIDSSNEVILLGEQCIWALEDVGPGPHSFTITFEAKKMPQEYFDTNLMVYMQVDDPVDGALPIESSNPLEFNLQRIYTIWEKIYWPWSGIPMALGIIIVLYSLWYYLKPVPPTIDDVFVIYRDGRLITHRKSRSGMREELDGDLVSAMLTAVQEFISDSLSKDRTDKIKKLEFGDRELFLERSENINIAVIYSGSMNKKLEEQIQELSKNIEEEHDFLVHWDGRMSKLDDIKPQVDELISEWQHLNGDTQPEE